VKTKAAKIIVAAFPLLVLLALSLATLLTQRGISQEPADTELLEQRRQRVEQMSASQKRGLLEKKQQFEKLSAEEQAALRELHTAIVNHPNSEQLQAVMQRYVEWLGNLNPLQRAELMGLPVEKRLEKIRQLREHEEDEKLKELGLVSSDAEKLLKGLSTIIENHEETFWAMALKDPIMLPWWRGDSRGRGRGPGRGPDGRGDSDDRKDWDRRGRWDPDRPPRPEKPPGDGPRNEDAPRGDDDRRGREDDDRRRRTEEDRDGERPGANMRDSRWLQERLAGMDSEERRHYLGAWTLWKDGKRLIEIVPPDEIARLIDTLSRAAQDRYFKTEANQRAELLVRWFRASAMHQHRPPPPTKEELEELLERIPDQKERDRLLKLPPAQLQAELRKYYEATRDLRDQRRFRGNRDN
jgi:hypothetical protein